MLILIDELQCLYGHPSPPQPLWDCIKRVIGADPGLKLRILAAAVFGNSSSAVQDQLAKSVSTLFEYGNEHIIGLRPAETDRPSLVLTLAEFDDLWDRMWSDVPAVTSLFQGAETKDSLFQLTVGQVMGLTNDFLSHAIESSFRLNLIELLKPAQFPGWFTCLYDRLAQGERQARKKSGCVIVPALASRYVLPVSVVIVSLSVVIMPWPLCKATE